MNVLHNNNNNNYINNNNNLNNINKSYCLLYFNSICFPSSSHDEFFMITFSIVLERRVVEATLPPARLLKISKTFFSTLPLSRVIYICVMVSFHYSHIQFLFYYYMFIPFYFNKYVYTILYCTILYYTIIEWTLYTLLFTSSFQVYLHSVIFYIYTRT